MASDDLPDPSLLEGGKHHSHPGPERTLFDESRGILDIREQVRELMKAAAPVIHDEGVIVRGNDNLMHGKEMARRAAEKAKQGMKKTVFAARRHPKTSGVIAGTALALGIAGYAISKYEKNGETPAGDTSTTQKPPKQQSPRRTWEKAEIKKLSAKCAAYFVKNPKEKFPLRFIKMTLSYGEKDMYREWDIASEKLVSKKAKGMGHYEFIVDLTMKDKSAWRLTIPFVSDTYAAMQGTAEKL